MKEKNPTRIEAEIRATLLSLDSDSSGSLADAILRRIDGRSPLRMAGDHELVIVRAWCAVAAALLLGLSSWLMVSSSTSSKVFSNLSPSVPASRVDSTLIRLFEEPTEEVATESGVLTAMLMGDLLQ